MTSSSEIIAGKRIVFLVGAPRSGTTWLQLMLARSADIATANETHLFDIYLRSLLDGNGQLSTQQRAIGLTSLFSEADYLEMLREVASTVLARILAGKPGASVILEKTPSHLRCWREIVNLFPDARFLHIVRDPRAVVASLNAARMSWGRTWVSTRLVENCEMWSAGVEDGRAIAFATGNCFEVRYEILKIDTATTLQAIFDWMEVPSSADDCLAFAHETSIDKLRAGQIENAPWAMTTEPQGFYRQGQSDSWRRELSEREIFIVESITKKQMELLGYKAEMAPRPSLRLARIAQVAILNRIRLGLGWRARRLATALSPQI